MVRLHHLPRRVQIGQRHALQPHAQAVRAVAVAAVLQPRPRLRQERLAAAGQQVGERLARRQLAQHRFGRVVHHAGGVVHLEQVHARIADRVTDGRLHLDEIAVARYHDRLLRHAVHAVVAVRTRPVAHHLPVVAGRPRAAEADLHRHHPVGPHARHGVHRPRPRPVTGRGRGRPAAPGRSAAPPPARPAPPPSGRSSRRPPPPAGTPSRRPAASGAAAVCSHSSTSKRLSSQRLTPASRPRQPAHAGPAGRSNASSRMAFNSTASDPIW